MADMATTRPPKGVHLNPDAALPEVIEAVNELSATLTARLAVSPSQPIDAPHPNAALVYSDEEYDALSDRLEAPTSRSERLRRTMAGRQTPDR